MNELRTRRRRLAAVLALGDAALVLASLAAGRAGLATPLEIAAASLLLVPAHLLVLHVAGLYVPRRAEPGGRFAVRIALAAAGGALLASAGLRLLPEAIAGRQPTLAHLPPLVASLLLWRAAVHRLAGRAPARRLAVVGRRGPVEELLAALEREPVGDYRIRFAVLLPDGGPAEIGGPELLADLETGEELAKLLEQADFDALALDRAALELGAPELERIVALDRAGVEVHDLDALHRRVSGSFARSALDGDSVLRAVIARCDRRGDARIKRLLDVGAAAAGLALLGAPMLLVALLVRLDSPGPAFFVQERLGHRRRPFRCIKFRTMVEGAERETGPRWAEADDPRVTRLGRFLRATRIDELPQLVNVLRGDMSLVGPRPIRDHFARRLAERIPFYDLRFGVPPGLTGWAQVRLPYAASEEDQEAKFRHELFYLRNGSLLLDLFILLETARVAALRRGH